MDNKQFIFKNKDGSITFVGDFDNYYLSEDNPWKQNDLDFSAGRKFLVVDYLRKLNPKNILDVGCGFGHLTIILNELIAPTVGIDISKVCILKAKKMFPTIDFRIRDIREKNINEKFNVVILNHILWYVLPKLEDVIDNIISYLTKGGYLVITHHFLDKQKYGVEKINKFPGLIKYLKNNFSDKLDIQEIYMDKNSEAIIILKEKVNE